MNHRRGSGRRGYALLYVLAFSAVLFLLFSSIMSAQVHFRDQNRGMAQELQERFVADCEKKARGVVR